MKFYNGAEYSLYTPLLDPSEAIDLVCSKQNWCGWSRYGNSFISRHTVNLINLDHTFVESLVYKFEFFVVHFSYLCTAHGSML